MTEQNVNANLVFKIAADYQKQALRTKSNFYFGQFVNRDNLFRRVHHISEVAERLDFDKKAIFYGKNIECSKMEYTEDVNLEVQDSHTQDLLHGTIGMITEAGEIAERLGLVISRRYGKPLTDIDQQNLFTEQDKVNLFEEMGDMLWYIAITAEAMGLLNMWIIQDQC